MKNNQVVYINPHLIIRPIQEGFFIIVNSWSSNGLKVINSEQFIVFDLINNRRTLEEIVSISKKDPELVFSFFSQLEKLDIINFSGTFKSPSWENKKPKSLNLWIHTTNKCNLGCSYCYIPTLQSTGGMSQEVISQLGLKLLQTVKEKNLQSVKIRLAGGEPLLQFKRWKEFIVNTKNELDKINCDFRVAFLTNLTFLTEEIIDFAKENKIGFGVSLDGFDIYHDITRKYHNGKGSFDKVDKNLKLLLRNGIAPMVSTVVTQQNMEGLYALTEYLIDLNISFRFSIVHGEYIDRIRLSQILTNCYDLMEQAIFEKNFKFSKKHRLCDLKPTEIFFQTCASGFSGGAVYVDGGMYFCHVKFGDNDLSGSLFDKEDLLTMISKNQGYVGDRSKDCMSCNYKYICTSGCPMYRVDGKDASCGLYHEQLPRFYELIGKERLHQIKKKQFYSSP